MNDKVIKGGFALETTYILNDAYDDAERNFVQYYSTIDECLDKICKMMKEVHKYVGKSWVDVGPGRVYQELKLLIYSVDDDGNYNKYKPIYRLVYNRNPWIPEEFKLYTDL